MTRTYVVTGSASGIGAATLAMLAADGHRVIGVDRHHADVVADLSTGVGRATMIEAVAVASGGTVDGVIACAGLSGGQHDPQLIIRVNYFGTLVSLEGLRHLLARSDTPLVVVVASIAVLLSNGDDPVAQACLDGDEEGATALVASDESEYASRAYLASKRAVARWVRRMAPTDAWAGVGIALNAVGPGLVTSPMTSHLLDADRRAETEQRYPMPLGGVADADHIASLLVWLTSEANARVTGQVIFADGGYDALERGEDVW